MHIASPVSLLNVSPAWHLVTVLVPSFQNTIVAGLLNTTRSIAFSKSIFWEILTSFSSSSAISSMISEIISQNTQPSIAAIISSVTSTFSTFLHSHLHIIFLLLNSLCLKSFCLIRNQMRLYDLHRHIFQQSLSSQHLVFLNKWSICIFLH